MDSKSVARNVIEQLIYVQIPAIPIMDDAIKTIQVMPTPNGVGLSSDEMKCWQYLQVKLVMIALQYCFFIRYAIRLHDNYHVLSINRKF